MMTPIFSGFSVYHAIPSDKTSHEQQMNRHLSSLSSILTENGFKMKKISLFFAVFGASKHQLRSIHILSPGEKRVFVPPRPYSKQMHRHLFRIPKIQPLGFRRNLYLASYGQVCLTETFFRSSTVRAYSFVSARYLTLPTKNTQKIRRTRIPSFRANFGSYENREFEN